MTDREPIVTVTANDCGWDYYRGSGAGGQHRNKTSSAVRCTHDQSGAVGQAEDTRSQHENRRLAFGRMVRTKLFQQWLKLETARRTGALLAVDEEVDRQMTRIVVEGKDAAGRWSRDAIIEDRDHA